MPLATAAPLTEPIPERAILPTISTAPVRPTAPSRLFHLREVPAAERPRLERFIAERFKKAYDADVHHFLPRLFGVHSAQHELLAGFGLRSAAGDALFLEQYLDAPVEQVISRVAGHGIDRAQIVEVGNLAGRHRGALRILIPLLAEKLAQENFRWLVFTGNPQLAQGFTRIGIQLHTLASARIDCLPEAERASWGRYYERAPSVLLGDIDAGRRYLAAHPELVLSLLEAGADMPGAAA